MSVIFKISRGEKFPRGTIVRDPCKVPLNAHYISHVVLEYVMFFSGDTSFQLKKSSHSKKLAKQLKKEYEQELEARKKVDDKPTSQPVVDKDRRQEEEEEKTARALTADERLTSR